MNKLKVHRHDVIQPLTETYRLIPLTQRQNAIVDVADFDFLSRWNWYADWRPDIKTFYVRTRDNGKVLYMHKVLFPDSAEVDHRNSNGLDNRRENLRPCTSSQNRHNTRIRSNNRSGFKGVHWHKAAKKWSAEIWVNSMKNYIGLFLSAEDAARAYDEKAKELHGDFAHLNFPD
jgi:hypothetical protein